MFNICFYKNFLHWLGITMIPFTAMSQAHNPRGISFSSGYFIGMVLAMISKRKRHIFQAAALSVVLISAVFMLADIKGEYSTVLTVLLTLVCVALGVAAFFVLQIIHCGTVAENKKDQLEGIFSHSTQGIILTDHTGKIVLTNPFLEKMFGYAKDELIGNTIQVLLPDMDLSQPLNMSGPVLYRDLLAVRKDGSTFPVEISFNKYTSGGETYLAGFIKDITESKKVELETLLLEDRLQSKNKELRQVAYMVSHDLRAPVAKILGLASIFDNDATLNKFIVEKISDATIELDNVVKDINNILSTRNIEKGKQEYVHFESKLKLITKVLEKEIKESKASITTDFQKSTGVVTAKGHLYSILYNLLSNSIKYRSPETPLRIHLDTTEHEQFVCLSIKDNGMGIDLMKNEEKVFGLYKKFHGDTIPGKGVGLHLVKTHAESLGGKVEIESKVNEGTQFKIYIPKKDEPTAE